MPTAEDLLARVSSNSTDSADDDNRFVISEDLRTITIPSGQDILGVMWDLDVRRVWFTLPRECDGTDLSDFVPYVNYVNALGESGFHRSNDLTVDEDLLTFSWIVGRRACAKDGTVTFSVALKKFDDDGETSLKEFNTTTTTMRVLQGLDSTGSDTAEKYVDEIAMFIRTLFVEQVPVMKMMTLADQVQTYQQLPTRNNTVGQVRNVAESGRNYVWTGSAWDDLGGMDAFTVSAATDAQIDALFA